MSSVQVYINTSFITFIQPQKFAYFICFPGNITLLYWSNWGLTGCSGFPKQLFRQAERLFQWPQTFPIHPLTKPEGA